MNIAVVGLGKLGAPLAAVLAAAGHSVVGVDVNWDTITKINRGVDPVGETGLAEILATPELDLAATDQYACVESCDVIFVLVPTPSGEDGGFVNDMLVSAVCGIGFELRNSTRRHVVVVSSTVMPGTMDGVLTPALLQAAAAKKLNRDLGLCYSPEFIALGSVIEDIRNPDMVLIGESGPRHGDLLEEVLRSVVGPVPPVYRMNLVNAELAKIAVNAYVTMKLSFANNLGEICEGIPGADASVVAAAIGADARIGGSYLRPALAYGGPCFPRDNRAYAKAAVDAGTHANLAVASDDINRRQVPRLMHRLRQVLPEGARVCVLGLAYKPQTAVTTESFGVRLVEVLKACEVHVTAWDPAARPEGIEMAESLEDALLGATVIVVTTAWPEFADIPVLPSQIVLDGWGIVQGDDVLRVGRG